MDEIVLRCAEARKQALILHRRGKRRSVHGAPEFRQLHALDRLRREDVHVLRPGKRRVGRLRAVRVVVAGGDEHSRLHCAQRLRERFQRLAIGRIAVKQVAREQHEIDAVLIHVIAKPRQQLAALAAALARLLGAQRAERAVQMEVRRVDDLHAHALSSHACGAGAFSLHTSTQATKFEEYFSSSSQVISIALFALPAAGKTVSKRLSDTSR